MSTPLALTQRRFLFDLAIAVAAVGACAALRQVVGNHFAMIAPFSLMFPAVMVAGWRGGLWPGLAAAALSTAVLWQSDAGTLDMSRLVLSLSAFFVVGVFITLLNESVHRSRRRADATAREQQLLQEQVGKLFESNVFGVIFAVSDGTITEANDAFLRMVGYPRAYVEQGRLRWQDLTPPEWNEADSRAIEQIRATGTLSPYEKEYIRRDGTRLPILIGGATVGEADGRVVCFVVDLTQLRSAERAARESEQRFRTMADQAPVLIWLSGADGAHTYFNRGWLEFTGRPMEQELGDGWMQGIHPEDAGRFVQTYHACMEAHAPLEMEYRLRRHDGEYRWIFAKAVPRFAPGGGEFVGYVGACVDIADRKAAEHAARLREDQLRLVTDALPTLISYVDRGHVYRFNNAAFGEWFGPARANIVGRHMRDVLGDAAYERVVPHMEAALRGERVTYEADLPYRDSGARRIEATYIPHRGADGQVEGVVTFVADVTQRRREEDRARFLASASELLGSTLDYQVTLERLARLVVPTLADWCAIDMVREGAGADAEEPASAIVADRLAVQHSDPAKVQLAHELHQRYPPKPDSTLLHVMATGEPVLFEHITDEMVAEGAQDADHLNIIQALGLSSAMIVPLRARGRTLGVIMFVTAESRRRYAKEDLILAEDVARRAALAVDNARLYRAAQEANRTKDEFLATVSHELRTPLNAILGWSQLLHQGALPPDEVAHGLTAIERNAKAQAELIEDLLDISRIITGKLRLNIHLVEVRRVVEAALDSVRPQAEARGIALNWRPPDRWEPVGEFVSGDAARLQQVIWNLLSNAIKFTPQGGSVTVEQMRSDDVTVSITVTDNGRGISPEFLPHVFDRFRQGESGTTRKYGGLGIGLSLVRHLVELHRGTVAAQSAGEGKGSQFTVALPLAGSGRGLDANANRSNAHPVSMATIESQPGHQTLAGLRVMVVEDENDTRELLDRMLSSAGARVTAVPSTADALRRLSPESADVLVSDIGMPGEDGYSLISQVRNHASPTLRAIPALALTALAREGDRQRALAAGFQMHMAKPIESSALVAAIAELAAAGTASAARV